jgi:hypothetical protein
MANTITSYQTAEYGKFLQLGENSLFPPVSVVRLSYPDNTSAFPENANLSPLSSLEIYPKYAVLTHIVNSDDIKVSLSAEEINVDFSKLETIMEGISSEVVHIKKDVEVVEDNSYFGTNESNPLYIASSPNFSFNVQYKDGANIDAFGRLRTSMPTTLFDSKTLHEKQSLFWSQSANGNASVEFTQNNVDASVTLSCTNVGEYAIRQTRQRFNYQPGKSQLAIFTGILEPVSNAIKRYGLFQSLTASPFTPNCGLYFETLTDSPSSIAVVQQNGDFLVPTISAKREEWNLDKLDGNGPSGKTLTLSACNIFLMDYEWLGVGRVRFGFVIDGNIIYCHEINNASSVLGAYLRTPNLPVRAEIRQISSGDSSMKIICSTVISEGGSDYTGVPRSVNSGTTPITVTNQYDRRALIGLRLQSQKLDSVNQLLNIQIANIPQGNATDAFYRYELLLNPTLGGSSVSWQNVSSDSNMQYSVVPNNTVTVNGGTIVDSGFSNRNGSIDLSGERFQKFLKLGCSIDGERDEFWVVFTPLDNKSGQQFASMTFVESD